MPLNGIAILLISIEFISAQSPHTMKGLLLGVGCVLCLQGAVHCSGLCICNSNAQNTLWRDHHSIFNCYFLSTTVLAVVGIKMVPTSCERWSSMWCTVCWLLPYWTFPKNKTAQPNTLWNHTNTATVDDWQVVCCTVSPEFYFVCMTNVVCVVFILKVHWKTLCASLTIWGETSASLFRGSLQHRRPWDSREFFFFFAGTV